MGSKLASEELIINLFMNKRVFCSLGVMALLLSSCNGDVKSTLGMRKPTPDEFVVVSYPPLSVPPELSRAAGEQNEEVRPAQNFYTKHSKHHIHAAHKEEQGVTAQDQQFLGLLGGKHHNHSQIKKAVDSEYNDKMMNLNSKQGVSRAISKARGEHEEPIINPESEKKRLENNAQQGIPINEGEVKDKDSSTLKRLFE